MIGSFLLLTVTYGQTSGGLQGAVSAAFSPLQEVSDRALKPARDLVGWFDQTFEARGENSRLREELAAAREEAVAGEEARAQNAELRKLVRLDRGPLLALTAYEPIGSNVIARSPTVWHAKVTIDAGSGDGVRIGDPVISGAGLVGSVAAVNAGSSQVSLLTDQNSAVSAKVLPGGAQGVVKPDIGNADSLILDFIDANRTIGAGQTVVTAGWRARGLASRFPPSLPVGEVTEASLREQEASQQVHLRPFADLANLDVVQVLTGGSRP